MAKERYTEYHLLRVWKAAIVTFVPSRQPPSLPYPSSGYPDLTNDYRNVLENLKERKECVGCMKEILMTDELLIIL